MKRVGSALLVIAAAFIIGRATVSAPSKTTTTERVIEHRQTPTRIVQSGVSADDIRGVVRDELAKLSHAPLPSEAPAQPTDEAAFARTQTVVTTGLADGTWATVDRDQLRRELPLLSPTQAREVLETLLGAINTGRVRVDLQGPPV